MGFSFKKLLKSVGKIAKPLLQTTPIGQAVLKAQSTLKGLGVNLKAARTKIQPVSVRAAIDKRVFTSPGSNSLATVPDSRRKRTAMPGGAPMRATKTRRAKKAPALPKAKKVRKSPSGAKRKPPTGGKDFRALSVSWKAAGKPGKWIDWVKAG